jgi:uncharacterized membrane protein YjjB (DUF3815 family)
MPDPTHLLIVTLAGFVATTSFAVLFNVPRSMVLYAALLGAMGVALRDVLLSARFSAEAASFSCAFLIGVMGYYRARAIGAPRLPFTVTGIIPLVPGIQAYNVLFYFSRGSVLEGVVVGVQAALIIGAIAFGLGAARIFTDYRPKLAQESMQELG